MINYRLMQVKSIAECSKGSILQYFRPSLSYHLSLRYLFCLFLSDRFTQVLLYFIVIYRLGPHCFMTANTMNTDQTVVEDSDGVCSTPPPPPIFKYPMKKNEKNDSFHGVFMKNEIKSAKRTPIPLCILTPFFRNFGFAPGLHSGLDPYWLHYRLPKNIKQMRDWKR